MSSPTAWLAFLLGAFVEGTAVVLPVLAFAAAALGVAPIPAAATSAAVAALLGGGLAIGGAGVLRVGLDWHPRRSAPAGVANGLLMAVGVGGLLVLAPSVLFLHG